MTTRHRVGVAGEGTRAARMAQELNRMIDAGELIVVLTTTPTGKYGIGATALTAPDGTSGVVLKAFIPATPGRGN